MHHARIWRLTLVSLTCLPLGGCFTAVSRWGGNKPTPSVTVGAAAADIATAPIQIPILAFAAIDHAASKPSKAETAQAKARHEAAQAERERMLALAEELQNRLQAEPHLLTSDEFWNQHAGEPLAINYALIWTLQKSNGPADRATNAYLLRRFPDSANDILANGRASHPELAALVLNGETAYEIREAAIDALARDRNFDFGEPWRGILIAEFPVKTGLLFGIPRYTRAEMAALATDPTQTDNVRYFAKLNLDQKHWKPEPTPEMPAPEIRPLHREIHSAP